MPNVQSVERLIPLRLLAMDIDGVLTDGRITWAISADGTLIEAKSFDVKDGLGISFALASGLQVAWITGRRSPLVARRAEELKVTHLCQGARDKQAVLTGLTARLGLATEQVLYLGDDLNDLPAFRAAGVKVAVADAAQEVRAAADWVTDLPGGKGAVREVIDAVLAAQERREEAVRIFLDQLSLEQRQDEAPEAPRQ